MVALPILLSATALSRPPHAPDTTPDFTVDPTSVELPRPCDVAHVKPRLLSIVHAFNTGRGRTFADQFTPRPSFQPYTGDAGRRYATHPRVTSRELTRFVNARYAAGDGWTASRLEPPLGDAGLPAEAIYGLSLTVSYPRGRIDGGAKIIISCSSGLVRRWVGPAYSRSHP